MPIDPVPQPGGPAWWEHGKATVNGPIDWWTVPVYDIHVQHMRHLVACSWNELITRSEWAECLWPIAHENQVDVLVFRHADLIEPASLNELLVVWWTMLDHGWREGRHLGYDNLIRWFRRARYVTNGPARGDEEISQPPTAPLTVYRGDDRYDLSLGQGISWTPLLELAELYARGRSRSVTDPPGWVWTATVNPEDVLGRIRGDGYDEIIIDPHHLRNATVREVTSAAVPAWDTETAVSVLPAHDLSPHPAIAEKPTQAAPAPFKTPPPVAGSHLDLAAIDLTGFGGQPCPVAPIESRILPELWPGMSEPNDDAIDWEAVPVFEIHLQHMRHLVRHSWEGLVTVEDWRQCLLPMWDETQIEALIVRYADHIAPASLNTLLPVCWTMCNHGQRQGYDRMVRWFRRAGYTSNASLIGDQDIAQPPTKPMVLYRGTDSPLLDAGLGLSWTPDRDTAEDIAIGFKESFVSEYDATPGWVWSATVDPENVLGWFREPGLDEILVDAKQLRNVEVREVARPEWPSNEPDQLQPGEDVAE